MRGTKPHLIVINGMAAAFPAAPGWMSSDAQAEWRRMQPFLEERKVLTDIDLSNLENYCVAQGRVRECEAAMRGVEDIDRRAKLWRMQNQAMTQAKQLGAELGLTPMARSRSAFTQLDMLSETGDGDINPLDIS